MSMSSTETLPQNKNGDALLKALHGNLPQKHWFCTVEDFNLTQNRKVMVHSYLPDWTVRQVSLAIKDLGSLERKTKLGEGAWRSIIAPHEVIYFAPRKGTRHPDHTNENRGWLAIGGNPGGSVMNGIESDFYNKEYKKFQQIITRSHLTSNSKKISNEYNNTPGGVAARKEGTGSAQSSYRTSARNRHAVTTPTNLDSEDMDIEEENDLASSPSVFLEIEVEETKRELYLEKLQKDIETEQLNEGQEMVEEERTVMNMWTKKLLKQLKKRKLILQKKSNAAYGGGILFDNLIVQLDATIQTTQQRILDLKTSLRSRGACGCVDDKTEYADTNDQIVTKRCRTCCRNNKIVKNKKDSMPSKYTNTRFQSSQEQLITLKQQLEELRKEKRARQQLIASNVRIDPTKAKKNETSIFNEYGNIITGLEKALVLLNFGECKRRNLTICHKNELGDYVPIIALKGGTLYWMPRESRLRMSILTLNNAGSKNKYESLNLDKALFSYKHLRLLGKFILILEKKRKKEKKKKRNKKNKKNSLTQKHFSCFLFPSWLVLN